MIEQYEFHFLVLEADNRSYYHSQLSFHGHLSNPKRTGAPAVTSPYREMTLQDTYKDIH